MSQVEGARGEAGPLAVVQPNPLVVWAIPVVGGSTVELAAVPGRVTVFVGPNGSGKSALAQWLTSHPNGANVKRIIAHRRVWLQSAGGDITFTQRDRVVSNMSMWDQSPDSRWLDHADSQRASVALLDLTALENARNAHVARLVESGESRDAILDSVAASPLGELNQVLSAAGLRVQLEIGEHVALKARGVDSGSEYPASEMSDGEKSALLLSAEVLTARTDSVIVIDEPERHLHRAISAELVNAVLASRPDCHFVLMTHDVDLAALLQSRGTQVMSVSDTAWNGREAAAWTIHALDEGIPEEARRAVLGGRAQVLYVEGDEGSPDLALYRLLFPEWSPIPVGSCETVIRSVVGLNQTATIHWVSARGIVDHDGRDADEIRALRAKGILVLPVSEVESLYYHPDVVEAIARRQAEFLGASPEELRDAALGAGIAELKKPGVAERLANSASVKAMSRRVVEAVPQQDLTTAGSEVLISVENPYIRTLDEIRRALEGNDFAAVARLAPVRDSAALAKIRETLRLAREDDYEAAARTLIGSNAELRARLEAVVGSLP